MIRGAWKLSNDTRQWVVAAGTDIAVLSDGLRERIALPRALLLNRRGLILDETTSAHDPVTGADIVSNVRKLASGNGIAVPEISLQPAQIAMADYIIRMQNGDITELTLDAARLASG